MEFQIVFGLCVASFIGGVVAWHFFHTKVAVEIAKLEGKVSAILPHPAAPQPPAAPSPAPAPTVTAKPAS